MKQELKIPHHAKPVLSRLRRGGGTCPTIFYVRGGNDER